MKRKKKRQKKVEDRLDKEYSTKCYLAGVKEMIKNNNTINKYGEILLTRVYMHIKIQTRNKQKC